MQRNLFLYLIVLCSLAACKKDSDDNNDNAFKGTYYNGAFVHANSSPSTEEPFRLRFTTNDSLVYSSIDGHINGIYHIAGDKMHINLNNGAILMEATIKGSDSLVNFQNTKTGDFSYKRAGKVNPSNTWPTGNWAGTYSVTNNIKIAFTVAPYLTLQKDVFNGGNDWEFVFVYQAGWLSIYNAGVKGKYFVLVQGDKMFGSFNAESGTNRVSFKATKQP